MTPHKSPEPEKQPPRVSIVVVSHNRVEFLRKCLDSIEKSEGRDTFRRYFDSAIDVPGPATQALSKTAKNNAVHLVIGVIEREIGTLYCTALFFAPDGALLGKHRKLMPTAMERIVWGYGDGSTLPVFETPLGKLGAVICWENYMPLLRMAMYAKGIQLYCAPTADDRDTNTGRVEPSP